MSDILSNSGVHVTHCCVIHGCKYGDVDCPVAQKEVPQKYACEYCGEADRLVIFENKTVRTFTVIVSLDPADKDNGDASLWIRNAIDNATSFTVEHIEEDK